MCDHCGKGNHLLFKSISTFQLWLNFSSYKYADDGDDDGDDDGADDDDVMMMVMMMVVMMVVVI